MRGQGMCRSILGSHISHCQLAPAVDIIWRNRSRQPRKTHTLEPRMSQTESYPSSFDGLLEILARLRGPDGCPWDREQTRHSLKRQFVEEVFELLEAIDQDDADLMAEELGDVLLHLAYQLRMGEETGDFRSTEVFAKLVEKLVRRHPHVFGGAIARDAREVEASWEAIKRREREETQDEDASMLRGVPKGMPSLAYAQTIQVRAARTGFDWDDYRGVLEKVSEELGELAETETEPERERELGDLLFSIVNAARWLDLDAEGALRKANARFYQRFARMEALSRQRGLSFLDLPMEHKESLWREAKAAE